MKRHLDTRTDLVAELEKVEPRTPLIEQIIAEAKAGEFHDFKNEKYVCGKIAANELLTKAGLHELAARIRNGDFDEPADPEDSARLMGLLKDSVADREVKRIARELGPAPTAPIPSFQGKVGQAISP